MNSLPALIGGLVTVLTILAAIVQIADYLEKKRRKKPEAVLPAAEPAPAAAASPPQTEVPPQVKNGSTAVNEVPSAPYLQTFAGDNITEIPAKGMMEKLGPYEKKDYGILPGLETTGQWVYYNFYALGISVSCDGDIIRAIHFYSGRDNTNFSRYPGELPFNIRWEDTREEIEARLGPPDEVRPGVHAIDAYYHRLALTINYDRLYNDDQAAKMQHVILQKIKPL